MDITLQLWLLTELNEEPRCSLRSLAMTHLILYAGIVNAEEEEYDAGIILFCAVAILE